MGRGFWRLRASRPLPWRHTRPRVSGSSRREVDRCLRIYLRNETRPKQRSEKNRLTRRNRVALLCGGVWDITGEGSYIRGSVCCEACSVYCTYPNNDVVGRARAPPSRWANLQIHVSLQEHTDRNIDGNVRIVCVIILIRNDP